MERAANNGCPSGQPLDLLGAEVLENTYGFDNGRATTSSTKMLVANGLDRTHKSSFRCKSNTRFN